MPSSIFWEDGGVFDLIEAEYLSAVEKHGFDRTPGNPDMPPGEKLAILVEEVGEVANAMTYDEGDPDHLKEELIQVATMACAWAGSLE